MKKTNVLVLVMFFFLATGCASTHKYSEDGRLFSYDENFKIIINTTNKGEIIQHYGIPTSTDTVGKYQILTYKHSQESFKAKGINRQAEVPAIMAFSLFAFSPFRPQFFSLLPPGTIRAGAQSPQGLSHVRHHVRKFLGFAGRNPLNPEALRFQAEVFQH